MAKHKRRAGKRRRKGAGKPCRENGKTLILQLPEINVVKLTILVFRIAATPVGKRIIGNVLRMLQVLKMSTWVSVTRPLNEALSPHG